MTENKKPTIRTSTASQTSDFATRRRVVRGLASVPVILTLGNGAAQANASIHQCITQAQPGEDPGCQELISGNDQPPSDDGLEKWAWDQLDVNGDNNPDVWCVAYAEEDQSGAVDVFGYTVNESGLPVAPSSGNPLLASCLCSFA